MKLIKLSKKLVSATFLIFSAFSLTANANIPEGRYILINKLSNKSLDVTGYSQANSANIIQWNLGSGLNQRWDLQQVNDDIYIISAAHSGKSLDIAANNQASGANVTQYTTHGNINQQWQLQNQGNGFYKLVSMLSGKALAVENSSTDNGANIQVVDLAKSDGQLWNLQVVAHSGEIRTGMAVTQQMGAGWNLGNTLDAIGGETNWGNPLTQEYMIQAIADKGFKTIRIPVTWQSKIAEDNSIDEAWMNRVEQVVNYAIDSGLYVIINLHHEEWVEPVSSTKEATKVKLQAVWQQIAERFKHYNQYLIFETLNEPRAHKGTNLEWSGELENYQIINEFNQVILSTVRASGYNNSTRLVMLPGYAASPWNDQTQHIEIPNDSFIAISTHGYFPYYFTEQEVTDGGDAVFNQDEIDLIDYVFEQLNQRFIANGIPVVMGEWGTVDKSNTADRVAYAQYYVQKATSYGIPTVVWDNNALGGSAHNYRLYNRANNYWPFNQIADAIVNGSN
ncbi:cellulase family glycosylhydrolase [Catenovulum agarivorans]|uniref:cellulase family glycosylhydrolase n=1 Tax=Catenovulum agarivorans TaxID=1172192 RepID=UPI000318C161|nr:cellulase family glycosylhydrolase [Catenovulum agarivorans]